MDLRCFVRVLPEPGDVAGGTGYLISPDRVLTAAHVVGTADRVSIEHDDAEGNGVVRLEATVSWRGDESCDIALLLLPEPAAIHVALPRLADTSIDTLTPWESRGWALVSEDEPLVRDSMVDLHGKASPFLADQKRFQLTIDVELERRELWHGASGAPVFVRGTSRILGVVADASKVGKNLWHASPLTVALRRPDFREKLGDEIARARRDQLIAKLIVLLEEPPALAATLAEGHDGWRSQEEKGGVEGLADAILGTDVVEALLALNDLHRRLCGTDDGQRPQLEEIIAYIAPLLVQRGLLHTLPNETGGVLLQLPVATSTVAELAVAGFDGRPSTLQPREGGFPDGLGRLPQPSPEEGFDVDGKANLRAYADHLAKLFLTLEDRQRLERLRSRAGGDKALDQSFGLVDDELEFQAEHSDRPLRRYFLYDGQFARDNQPFLAELRQRMKSIHLLEMIGDDLRGERRICRPLREILARGDETPKER